MKVKESALAHKYLDGLTGVEIGGAAFNPFNIPGCKNVDYTDAPDTMFKQSDMAQCGETMKVDIVADGAELPFPNDSLDYILSSHVMEHFKDPIGVLLGWMKIVRPGGYIFMIIPHKERTFDKDRPCTTVQELISRHDNPDTTGVDTHEHYSVWRTEDFLALCKHMGLNVVESHDVDDKFGNGFTVVIQRPIPGGTSV